MFHHLTRYVIDQWLPQTTSSSSTAAEGVESNTSSRLTSAETEDDWVLVERRSDDDSEGNSKCSSLESLNVDNDNDNDDDDGLIVVERSPDRVVVVNTNTGTLPVPALLTRTNSLPRITAMEESWFLTPPPCFISTGPVHMETSPLENLLIEHPSMSVYTHHGRRYNFDVEEETEAEVVEVVATEETGDSDDDGAVVVHRAPRVNRVHVLQQQERQGVKSKHAQKVQIQKSCKFVTRGTLDRTNKAREVNSRNRRQRRGERSQGATRSFANNNRKC